MGCRMGVERSVTRWYLYRQLILDEIAQLEIQLSSSPNETIVVEIEDATGAEDVKVDLGAIRLQLAVAHEKLKTLGHCPKPMMG